MSTTSPINPSPVAPPPPGDVVPQLRFRLAFDRVREQIEQFPQAELQPINIDIPSAVVTVLGCGPELSSLRAQVQQLAPMFMAAFETLETHALAAGHAHTQYVAASQPSMPIPQMSEELAKIRDLFVSDVTALAKRNYLDGARLKELRGPSGHKNIAFDVLMLCAMLRDNWTAIATRTGVQVGELDHAEQLADRLATAVGLKEQSKPGVPGVSATRQRAFSLMLRTYNEVRRVVSFIRWNEDDAEQYAPSLWAGRGRRSSKDDDVSEEAQPVAPTPPAPPSPAAPVGPAPAPNAGPGMPNSDPFGPA